MKMEQTEESKKILKIFSRPRILLATGIGLAITAWLFYDSLKDEDPGELIKILSNPNWFWLILAFVVLFARDLGYMFRIKNLTDGDLTWKGSIFTILLWEFSSAVTPSVVGGTPVAIFILNKEGIKFGKSVAYVMLTAILDNLFFIVAAPIFILLTTSDFFVTTSVSFRGGDVPLQPIFYTSYGLIAVYTLFMAIGVLVNPNWFQNIIIFIVRTFRFGSKWKRKAFRLSIDVITASNELRGKNFNYWSKAVLSTLFVWSARYFMLNCLLAAFSTMSGEAHLNAFSKQIVLWIAQLVSPTPGGAGFAILFLKEIFGGGILIIAVGAIWRIMTFYAYLIAGSVALPRWLRRVFGGKLD